MSKYKVVITDREYESIEAEKSLLEANMHRLGLCRSGSCCLRLGHSMCGLWLLSGGRL